MKLASTLIKKAKGLFGGGEPRQQLDAMPISGGGGYHAVTQRNEGRVGVPIETQGEDKILRLNQHNLLTAKNRSAQRNTSFGPATRQQLTCNVVGTVGGKLTLKTGDKAFDKAAGKWFSRWSRRAEFTNGIHFNELLKLVLAQLTHTGGDCVLVFDDGVFTNKDGSGRIRLFESDEIANIDPTVFDAKFGKRGYTQSNGLIYDRYGRHVGCFISSTQRGKTVFEEGKYLVLLREPDDDPLACNWLFVHQFWRANQGRGIATMSHIINKIQDLAEYEGCEIQAAKLNATVGMKIIDREANPLASISAGRGFGNGSGGGDSGEGGIMSESDGLSDVEVVEVEPVSMNDKFKAYGAAIADVAPGKDLVSFDTARPNRYSAQFIDAMKGDAATVFGMGLTFVNLDPKTSYVAFQGAMIIANASFGELKKRMERSVCDWAAVQVLRWAGGLGKISGYKPDKFPDDWDMSLVWKWPSMPAVNPVDAQTALEKKYANISTSLQEEIGADWIEHLESIKEEIEECERNGVLHPSLRAGMGGGYIKVEQSPSNGGGEKDE